MTTKQKKVRKVAAYGGRSNGRAYMVQTKLTGSAWAIGKHAVIPGWAARAIRLHAPSR